MSFDPYTIGILVAVALLIGMSRTALPGIGILFSSVAALVMPVRESTGFLLPMLLSADIMAVIRWRRSPPWGRLVRILPWAAAGIVIGYLLMGRIGDALFRPLLGGMIVAFVLLDLLRRRANVDLHARSRLLAAVLGVLAGITTMLANASGPIMAVYLLSMDLDKDDFVRTSAWFFLIVNTIKVPFSAALGLVTLPSLGVNLALLPVILAGEILGILLAKRISQKLFNGLAQGLAAAAGVKLLF